MKGRSCSFTQSAVTRVLRGVRAAGERVQSVFVTPNGEIQVVLLDTSTRDQLPGRPNDFDRDFG